MNRLILLAPLMLLPILFGCSNSPPLVSEDGLNLVPSDRLDELYIRTGTDFSNYRSLHVEQLDVSFDEGWLRQQNTSPVGRIRPRDQERIFTRVRKIFNEEFITRFVAENGYTLVDTPEPGSLTMKPALIDLRINAPDLMEPYSVTKLAEDAGSGRLTLELLDSDSGGAILRVRDYRRARNYGNTLRRQTSVENKQEAMMMMRRWADAVNAVIKPAAN